MSGLIQVSRSADAEVPSFVRRCRHRNAMSTAASEKLRTDVRWTTAAQGELAALFEITHGVVSYNPWPGPVVVRAGWRSVWEYWPAMSVASDTGLVTFVDVVHPQDEAERSVMEFDSLLREALRVRGIALLTVRRGNLNADHKVRVGKQVRSYTGWPMPDRGCVANLMQLVGLDGRGSSFGQLASTDGSGQSLVAAACLLVMRRALQLTVHRDGFAASILTVPGNGWGK